MAKTLILEVNQIEFHKDPQSGQVLIIAHGTAATPGYTNVELEPLEDALPPDGILDLKLVGTPPTVIVPQVLSPVTGNYVFEDGSALIGASVKARTNTMTALIGSGGGAGAAFDGLEGVAAAGSSATDAALSAQSFTTFPRTEEVKTLAFGEEGPKTLALGEEGPKTLAFGEEGPKTFRFGEEGPKTLAFGEEGPKTLFVGEEGPKSLDLGEEGPKTLAFGEEGPKTLGRGEETKPVFGETDPRVDDPTGPVGEDFGTDLQNQGRRNPFTRR